MKKNINRGRTAKDQGSFRGGVGRVGTLRRGSWTPGLRIGIRDSRPGLAPSLLSDNPTSGLLIPSFFPSRRQKTPDPVRPNASRDDQIKRSCLPDPSWPTPSRLQTRREGLCCMPPVDLADAGGCSCLRLRPPRAAFLHSFVMRQSQRAFLTWSKLWQHLTGQDSHLRRKPLRRKSTRGTCSPAEEATPSPTPQAPKKKNTAMEPVDVLITREKISSCSSTSSLFRPRLRIRHPFRRNTGLPYWPSSPAQN